MHEMKFIRTLFEDLLKRAEENGAKKVTKVNLRMGEFTEINEEILQYFFKEKGSGTPLEGAQLKVERSPARELCLVSFDCE